MVWLTSITGFIALSLIGVIALIPYSTRWINRSLAKAMINFRGAMGVHQLFGFMALAIVILHMDASVGAGMMGRVNAMGLNLATVGLFVLFAQSIVGTMLRQSDPQTVLLWRRIHWCLMLGIVGLVAAHVYLNGMIIYTIF